MYTYSFEKLDVWNLARKLAITIYSITAKFPETEKFGMVNQLRRAIISVCSNLAEGSSRKSSREKAHFYTLSYSSLVEVLNQLLISQDLGWIKEEVTMDVRREIESISRQLNSLRNSALNPDTA